MSTQPNKFAMLKILESIPDDGLYYNFGWIGDVTKFPREHIQLNIKELRRLGHVEFQHGLMDEDNNVKGSGYCITQSGVKYRETEVAL